MLLVPYLKDPEGFKEAILEEREKAWGSRRPSHNTEIEGPDMPPAYTPSDVGAAHFMTSRMSQMEDELLVLRQQNQHQYQQLRQQQLRIEQQEQLIQRQSMDRDS